MINYKSKDFVKQEKFRRIFLHVANELDDTNLVEELHGDLRDSKNDQLSLAALNFKRNNFQESADIYKRLSMESKEDLALNVYIAMCYYRMDYYDVSLEVLSTYTQTHRESLLAANVKACNQFKLFNGSSAVTELKKIFFNDELDDISIFDENFNLKNGNVLPEESKNLLQHNLVVFNEGKNALKILPKLINVYHEAKLNLAIHFLKKGQIEEAYETLNEKSFTPASPQEYIIMGVIHAKLTAVTRGTEKQHHLAKAQEYFQIIGTSTSECDTIPGRQCMASCFMMLKQYEEVIVYLQSIKTYLTQDDDFNYNYGFSLCKAEQYEEAEFHLQLIQNEKYLQEFSYVASLCRCYINNKKADVAWKLYLEVDNTSLDKVQLIQVIANDCYRAGQFLFAAKAFDVLEKVDKSNENWYAKRGAIAGCFKDFITNKISESEIGEAVSLLNSSNRKESDLMRSTIVNYIETH